MLRRTRAPFSPLHSPVSTLHSQLSTPSTLHTPLSTLHSTPLYIPRLRFPLHASLQTLHFCLNSTLHSILHSPLHMLHLPFSRLHPALHSTLHLTASIPPSTPTFHTALTFHPSMRCRPDGPKTTTVSRMATPVSLIPLTVDVFDMQRKDESPRAIIVTRIATRGTPRLHPLTLLTRNDLFQQRKMVT